MQYNAIEARKKKREKSFSALVSYPDRMLMEKKNFYEDG